MQIFDLDDMNLVVDYLLIREGWERVRAQAEDEVRQEELQKALDLLRKEQTARKTRLAHRTHAHTAAHTTTHAHCSHSALFVFFPLQ
jgi:gamma-glutamyl:cysteine ligase YbdK (ATP-grasp superfamily)